MPEELATTVDIVARGRGISVNALVVEALVAEIEKVKKDDHFMETLRKLTERDRAILDRLAQEVSGSEARRSHDHTFVQPPGD
jgi:glutamate-1-semialdehyde aminotransferase